MKAEGQGAPYGIWMITTLSTFCTLRLSSCSAFSFSDNAGVYSSLCHQAYKTTLFAK